jgi:hypothetical protein
MLTIPNTPDSKKEVVRYESIDLAENIRDLIEHIDFQTTTEINGQAYIYFKLPAIDASVERAKQIGEFIMNRPEWKGDRSITSIGAEIYIHWVAENMKPYFMVNPINQALWKSFVIGTTDARPSPIYPTHLGYNYKALSKTHPMDQFLLTL